LFPYPLAIIKGVVSPNDSLLCFNPFMSEANVDEFVQTEVNDGKPVKEVKK
jgi:hypothetical protein